MKAFPTIGALAALVVLAACAGQPPPAPCVSDWRTACSGPETNGGDAGAQPAPTDEPAA